MLNFFSAVRTSGAHTDTYVRHCILKCNDVTCVTDSVFWVTVIQVERLNRDVFAFVFDVTTTRFWVAKQSLLVLKIAPIIQKAFPGENRHPLFARKQ